MTDQIYLLRPGEWYALVSSKEFGPWDNKGAALAGKQTEQRRAVRKL